MQEVIACLLALKPFEVASPLQQCHLRNPGWDSDMNKKSLVMKFSRPNDDQGHRPALKKSSGELMLINTSLAPRCLLS